MSIMDKLNNTFEKQISVLSYKEQVFFRNIKKNLLAIYNNHIKPILWAIFFFFLFDRIKNSLGIEYGFYIGMIIIIIMLRSLNSKLS